MTITENLLNKITDLSRDLTPISEISILLHINYDELSELIRDRQSDVSQAYHLGRAETAHKMRVQEIEMADAGSPMAVALVNQYLRDMDNDTD